MQSQTISTTTTTTTIKTIIIIIIINLAIEQVRSCEKYQNLAIELKVLWPLKEIAIVFIVVGCKGVVDKMFAKYIGKIPGKITISRYKR